MPKKFAELKAVNITHRELLKSASSRCRLQTKNDLPYANTIEEPSVQDLFQRKQEAIVAFQIGHGGLAISPFADFTGEFVRIATLFRALLLAATLLASHAALAASALDISGTWTTKRATREETWSAVFFQKGSAITARFSNNGIFFGQLNGQLEGETLHGSVTGDGASAWIAFTFTSDGAGFTGTGSDNDEWRGKRISSGQDADLDKIAAKAQLDQVVASFPDHPSRASAACANLAKSIFVQDGKDWNTAAQIDEFMYNPQLPKGAKVVFLLAQEVTQKEPRASPASEADRLNGLEYDATVEFVAKVYRLGAKGIWLPPRQNGMILTCRYHAENGMITLAASGDGNVNPQFLAHFKPEPPFNPAASAEEDAMPAPVARPRRPNLAVGRIMMTVSQYLRSRKGAIPMNAEISGAVLCKGGDACVLSDNTSSLSLSLAQLPDEERERLLKCNAGSFTELAQKGCVVTLVGELGAAPFTPESVRNADPSAQAQINRNDFGAAPPDGCAPSPPPAAPGGAIFRLAARDLKWRIASFEGKTVAASGTLKCDASSCDIGDAGSWVSFMTCSLSLEEKRNLAGCEKSVSLPLLTLNGCSSAEITGYIIHGAFVPVSIMRTPSGDARGRPNPHLNSFPGR